jgi:hypothetical protein
MGHFAALRFAQQALLHLFLSYDIRENHWCEFVSF